MASNKKRQTKSKQKRKRNSKSLKKKAIQFQLKPYLYALGLLLFAGLVFVVIFMILEKINKPNTIGETKKSVETKPALIKPLSQAKEAFPKIAEKPLSIEKVKPKPKPEESRSSPPKPVLLPPSFPQIAIVIDDMGLDLKRSLRALNLPKEISLAYFAFAPNIKQQTLNARAKGHELLVHVPMEAKSGKDPGTRALLVKDNSSKIKENLLWHLSQFDGFIGINNHMGSKFTEDKDALEKMLPILKDKKLIFLDSKTSNQSQAQGLAKACSLPCLERHIFLDHDPSPKAIGLQLKNLEDLATKNGVAIAIGHPKEETLEALEKWIPTLIQKKINLVPLSALVLPWQ